MSKTSLALFVGLGVRLLVDQISGTPHNGLVDTVLSGVWQGIGLHYTLTDCPPTIPFIVILGISLKLLLELSVQVDVVHSVISILGVALGVLLTDVLSQVFESRSYFTSTQVRTSSPTTKSSSSPDPPQPSNTRHRHHSRQHARINSEDITAPSLSSSLVDPARYPTPIARDVAILRARASLADSERRRYKEERTWALAQGNKARADEMAWQAERYHAMMRGFHEQADRLLFEADRRERDDKKASTPLRHASAQTRLTSARSTPAESKSRRRTSSPAPLPIPVRTTLRTSK